MKWMTCAALICLWCLSQVTLAQESELPQHPQDITQAQTGADVDLVMTVRFELFGKLDDTLSDLLKRYVSVLSRASEKTTTSELRLVQFSVTKEIADILATAGYFSPVITYQTEGNASNTLVKIVVELGPPTHISATHIEFVGEAVPQTLQQLIRAQWGLPVGAQFRDDDWSRSKNVALNSLTEHSYAAAKISSSQALVQDQLADLSLELDSGPAFHIGELHIKGLNLYQAWLIERYHPPEKGDIYNREKLLKFQRELQNSPYFSSVTVSVDPTPELADAVPVEVLVSERQQYEVGLGAGYSSNTGARGELSFRDRNFWNDAYDFRSVMRIEQLRQIGYADIYLPPRSSGYLDSFGVLVDRSDISGLLTSTSSFGAKRVLTEGSLERRLGVSFVYEESTVNGGSETLAKALVNSIGWTWRNVNSMFEPRQGQITQVDIGAAAKALLSDQNFVRLYGKYQRWIPVGTRDSILLRVEGGYVIAPSSVGIPEDDLFRAGGTGSVRGYAYQSLGVNQDAGVTGGIVMTTASAEYVHWLTQTWGVAAFVDVGDAADKLTDLSLKQGAGFGVRYKTPAGPIAVDLAYGRQTHKLRLDFSIGIAF